MTVDGFANLPLRSAPVLNSRPARWSRGRPYTAILQQHRRLRFILHGFYNDPYNVPFLGGMDYWDTITPNSAFIFPNRSGNSRERFIQASVCTLGNHVWSW
jgi:hypothetical protein